MRRTPRKLIGLLLAAALLAAALPLCAQAAGTPADGDSPLRVEITACKKRYTLLSTITYTVTVTNISDEDVRNVSAEVLFGKDLSSFGSPCGLEKSSLAPGESLRFRCGARLHTLRGADILLFPLKYICDLFAKPALDEPGFVFGNGRQSAQASARVKLLSFFDKSYDTACTARVWFGYPATDDFSSVLVNDFFEGCDAQSITVNPDTPYYLILSRARNLCAGIQACGAAPAVSTIRHNAAWTFAPEDAGDGSFAIRSLATGLTLAAEGLTNIQMEAYTGAANQLWTARAGRDGHVQLINAGSGKALDIGGGDTLVQREPGTGASQLWELNPIDACDLARPYIPDLNGRTAWARNALRYPEEGRPVPAGPIYIQWYQDASIGEVEYYELAFDGQAVYVLPSDALLMGYRWYSTQAAQHTVQITAVLKDGGSVAGDMRSFPVSKKGLGWGTLHRVEDLRLSWYYNWYTTPCAGLPRHLQYEPQVWGDFSDLGLDGLWAQGFRSVMAFNEPDSATQADMPAARAAALWPRFTGTGLRLGSPVTAGPAQESAWFAEFMDAAGENVDFIVLHIYDSKASVSQALDIVDKTWQKYRKPIWIKELAVASFGADSPWGAGRGGSAAVAAFMERLLGELDKRAYVERYAWYPFGTDDPYGGASALFDYATGELTALGKVYRALP